MAHDGPTRIRNVAPVGHRGAGKSSLNEALLFEAGAVNRLGSVTQGTTVSDSSDDEKARGMSIALSLASLRWQDHKINGGSHHSVDSSESATGRRADAGQRAGREGLS